MLSVAVALIDGLDGADQAAGEALRRCGRRPSRRIGSTAPGRNPQQSPPTRLVPETVPVALLLKSIAWSRNRRALRHTSALSIPPLDEQALDLRVVAEDHADEPTDVVPWSSRIRCVRRAGRDRCGRGPHETSAINTSVDGDRRVAVRDRSLRRADEAADVTGVRGRRVDRARHRAAREWRRSRHPQGRPCRLLPVMETFAEDDVVQRLPDSAAEEAHGRPAWRLTSWSPSDGGAEAPSKSPGEADDRRGSRCRCSTCSVAEQSMSFFSSIASSAWALLRDGL